MASASGTSALFDYVWDAERYDAAVAEVLAGVRSEHDNVDNLGGLASHVTMDGIGHVHESDAGRVLRHLRRAIDQGVGLGLFRCRPVWRRLRIGFALLEPIRVARFFQKVLTYMSLQMYK